jgi:hypothetical protein
LQRQNTWAEGLNRELAGRNARIGDLQKEVDARLTWIRDLESQIDGAQVEIDRLHAEHSEFRRTADAEIQRQNAAIDVLEGTVIERTLWAQRLDAELVRIRSSKWFRAGAKLRVGPNARDGG